MTDRAVQNEPAAPGAAIGTLGSEMTEQLAGFQAYVRFESVDPETNRWRFYDLLWQPTLFGEGALVRVWGRQSQSRYSTEGTLCDVKLLYAASWWSGRTAG